MSAVVQVSIAWDGTEIIVSSSHDKDSEGSPADSRTSAYDVIDMLRDCAKRAEDAAASSIGDQDR